MERWDGNHPNYSVISIPPMPLITSFGVVCTLHFYSDILRSFNYIAAI